uniref:Uncharacterized protein n=1 Tax=Anguilla anguilla TaxID=7936 RepID=A0A0E9VW31_ANGAN
MGGKPIKKFCFFYLTFILPG